jgi:hypothetical protein
MKYVKLVIIVVFLTSLAAYIFLFNLRPYVYRSPDIKPFSKDGFVDAMTLSNNHRLVAENTHFMLHIDETTSYITITDKRNGETWHSNPIEPDPTPGKTLHKQQKIDKKQL